MGAFVKTTRVCAVALGLGMSLGVAVSSDPSAALAAPAASQQRSAPFAITSSTEVDAEQPFDITGTAAPNSRVAIYELLDGFVEVRTDATGAFRHRAEKGLRAGVQHLSFFVGNESKEHRVEYRVAGADGVVPELVPLTIDEPEWVAGERLTLSGRATPGATVGIDVRTASVDGPQVTADEDGRWSATTRLPLTGVEHDVRVRQAMPFGDETKKLTVRTDTSAMQPLHIDEPQYEPGEPLTLTGTGTAGAKVSMEFRTISIPSTEVTVGEDGRWSATSKLPVTGVEHEVRVRHTSRFAEESKKLVIRADAAEFTALTVAEPDYSPGERLTLSGTATPGATVSISGATAGIPRSEVAVRGDGTWSFTASSPVTGPRHELEVRQTSDLGADRTTVTVVAGPSAFTPLSIDEPAFTPGERLTLSGRATPGAKITIGSYSASLFGEQTTVRADGTWTYTSPSTVNGATHVVEVFQTTKAGEDHKTVTVTGDTSAFTPLEVTEPAYVPGQRLTLSGTATPGARIQLDGRTAGLYGERTTVGQDGRWTFTSNSAVTGIEHKVEVRQTSSVGSDAKTITIAVDDSAFTPLEVTDPVYKPGERLTLRGTATPGAQVRVEAYTAGIYTADVTVGTDGTWTFTSDSPVTGLKHDIDLRQRSVVGEDRKAITVEVPASSFTALEVTPPEYRPHEKTTVSGTATPGASIRVDSGWLGVATTTVGEDGRWTVVTQNAGQRLQDELRVRQESVFGTDTKRLQLEARDSNGDPVRFRALERTSEATFVYGTTTRLTGTATPFSAIRVDLSNPGGKPLPGGPTRSFEATVRADGTWTVDLPDHKLAQAKVRQYGETGNDSLSFTFTRA